MNTTANTALGEQKNKTKKNKEPHVIDKSFILQRICAYVGREINPDNDAEVTDVLKRKFNILLPQRRSLDDSLTSSASDHEIIDLLKQYRSVQ